MGNLFQYKLNDEEKERVLFAVLKSVRYANSKWIPLFFKKKLTAKRIDKFNELYADSKCTYYALCELIEGGYVEYENGKTVLSKRGQQAVKRGWIYCNCKWYNTSKATKIAVIISLAALFLTLVQFAISLWLRWT